MIQPFAGEQIIDGKDLEWSIPKPAGIVLFRPVIMFGVGVFQALVPYVLWQFGFGVTQVGMDLTYLPIVLWGIASISFVIGTIFGTALPRTESGRFELKAEENLIPVLAAVCAVGLLLQVGLQISVYGTLPLLSYIRGDGQIDVGTANLLEAGSGMGQIGALAVSCFLMNGMLLTLLIVQHRTGRSMLRYFIPCVAIALIANMVNGKRQGVLVLLFYILCGLGISGGGLLRSVSAVLFQRRSRWLAGGILVVVGCVFYWAFGYLSISRTQGVGGRDSGDEVVSYLEFPTLNLESQCAQAGGLGPVEFNLFYPLLHLLPYKWVDSTEVELPRHLIPSSPAGLMEQSQWTWGPIGVAIYCFLLGVFAQWLYLRATSSLSCLLVYCQVAYALFMCNSYNHIASLVFFALPSAAYWMYAMIVEDKTSSFA